MKKLLKHLRACLKYCEEQNGMEDCKNCGLSKRIVDEFEVEEAAKHVVKEHADVFKRLAESDKE